MAADAGADDDKIVVVVVRATFTVSARDAERRRSGCGGRGARSSVSRVWVRLTTADGRRTSGRRAGPDDATRDSRDRRAVVTARVSIVDAPSGHDALTHHGGLLRADGDGRRAGRADGTAGSGSANSGHRATLTGNSRGRGADANGAGGHSGSHGEHPASMSSMRFGRWDRSSSRMRLHTTHNHTHTHHPHPEQTLLHHYPPLSHTFQPITAFSLDQARVEALS